MCQSKYRSAHQASVMQRAAAMRSAPTRSEQALWELLRGKQRRVWFRRQVPVGRFIADFAAVPQPLDRYLVRLTQLLFERAAVGGDLPEDEESRYQSLGIQIAIRPVSERRAGMTAVANSSSDLTAL